MRVVIRILDHNAELLEAHEELNVAAVAHEALYNEKNDKNEPTQIINIIRHDPSGPKRILTAQATLPKDHFKPKGIREPSAEAAERAAAAAVGSRADREHG